jgi:hypothetical protein
MHGVKGEYPNLFPLAQVQSKMGKIENYTNVTLIYFTGSSAKPSKSSAATATAAKGHCLTTTMSNIQKEQETENDDDPHLVRLQAIAGGIGRMKRTSVAVQALQDAWNSMNDVFGDACPGSSKKLYIHYVFLPSNHNPPL